jgi:hypothetical protein
MHGLGVAFIACELALMATGIANWGGNLASRGDRQPCFAAAAS